MNLDDIHGLYRTTYYENNSSLIIHSLMKPFDSFHVHANYPFIKDFKENPECSLKSLITLMS